MKRRRAACAPGGIQKVSGVQGSRGLARSTGRRLPQFVPIGPPAVTFRALPLRKSARSLASEPREAASSARGALRMCFHVKKIS